MTRCYFMIAVVALSALAAPVIAKGTYQEPDAFVAETFGGDPPEPSMLWIRKSMQRDIMDIMDRKLKTLRLRYWTRDGRYAYILEEVGKEKPITVGLVVREGEMEKIQILVFREVRGWEVRHPFFTDQFKGVKLDHKLRLDEKIDGISGATLSVRAVTKLARLSLYLFQHCAELNAEKS